MKHTISALALLSIATTQLFAEESPVPAIPELPVTIVTGELWESELQKTTASVTVLNQTALADKGVQHFEDVINAIPNLTWTGGTSRPRYIQIRGIGENSQFEGETPDSSVRFLVDDLDFTGVGTIGNLFDVQQVEVLRGPQAGAFGANAAGGMIRIVTNEPTPYWTGQTESTIGNDSLFAGGFAVGGPLLENDPEKLTFRFALHQLTQDGFLNNQSLNREDTNECDELTTRLRLRWRPNEDWQWDGTLFYADADNGYDQFSLTNDRNSTFTDEPGRDEQETYGASLRAQFYGNDSFNVTSITSYMETNALSSADGDFTNVKALIPNQLTTSYSIEREREVINQEIRFDSADSEDALGFIDRWTTGIYFQSFDEQSGIEFVNDGTPSAFQTAYESETFSLYGQGTHLLGEKTRITLGVRAEYFDLETNTETAGRMDYDDWLWGGKMTLESDLSEQLLFFASITRGYKAGGVNIDPSLHASLPSQYETEDLWNYEVGLSSEWFDGKVVSKVTFFYLDRSDAQLRGSEGNSVYYSYFTLNGDEAEHYGLETESSWFIRENLTLTLTGGLLETERDAFSAAKVPPLAFESRDVSNSPNYTYSARLDYIPAEGFFASVEVTGSDEYFEENTHSEKRRSFNVVNASIGYRLDNWTLSLWSKNLLGEEYEDRVFFFDNYDGGEKRYEAPAAPRTFGVTANYKW
jgi:outer membrane receptor protein involved in Fe transport